MEHSRQLRAYLMCALVGLFGCGGGDDASGNDVGALPDAANHDVSVPQDGLAEDSASTPRILLEAQLMAPMGTTLKAHWAKVPEQGIPLEGYQLYCVTFATPPSAATGTADAGGQLKLWLEAENVPFGCFVLDAQGKAVASLVWVSGMAQGQTVTLTGDADVGTIWVDMGHGVALAELLTAGTLASTANLECPLGNWVVTTPSSQECGDATARFYFLKTPEGEYTASFTVGPLFESELMKCSDNSKAGLPVTLNEGAFSFSFQHDPNHCPSRMASVKATPTQECDGMEVEYSYGPCESCQEGECGCETGTQTCATTVTAYRE